MKQPTTPFRICFLLFVCLPLLVQAQHTVAADTAQVRQWIREASAAAKQFDFVGALSKLKQAAHPLLQSGDTLTLLYCQILYQKAACLQSVQPSMRRFEESIALTDHIIDTYSSILGRNSDMIAQTQELKGEALLKATRYSEAIEVLDRALKMRTALSGEHAGWRIINGLSKAYRAKGDIEKSAFYILKQIDIQKKTLDEKSFSINNIYGNLAITYKNLGDYEKSLFYHNLSIALKEKFLDSLYYTLIISYSGRGITKKRLGLYDEALADMAKARHIASANWEETRHPDHANSYLNAADVLRLKKDYPKSIEYFEKAIELYKTFGEREYSSIAECHYGLAEVYFELGEVDRVTSHLRLAEKFNHYNKAGHFEAVVEIGQLIKTYYLHNQNYQLRYTKTRKKEMLDSAYHAGQIGINAIDFQRNALAFSDGRSRLTASNYPMYEGVLQTLKTLKTINARDTADKQAFAIAEQCKSLQLYEAMKNTEARSFGQIAPAYLEKEKEIQQQLNAVEKRKQQLIADHKPETDSTYVETLALQLEWQLKQDSLKVAIAAQYGNYYHLRYADLQIGIAELQTKILAPNKTLLEYFVGDSSIFAFIVKPGFYEMAEIKKDFPLEIWVKSLRTAMTDQRETAADVYTDLSFKLYQKLVQPFKSQLSEEVVIVPDGVLGYIPFEALLMRPAEKAVRFQEHAYLLRDHRISYCFSATLLREMSQKQHQRPPAQPFLAYAPFFDGDTTVLAEAFENDPTMRRDLAPLVNSGEEALGAARLMRGKAIVGAEATEAKFLETAPNARLIHLATHGKAHDKSGDYSFLAFSALKDSVENELLYVRDLYGMTLNADMVVLSACETGVGALQRGEGVISLARAFAYAGAKSIVTSLWAVNDAKTKDLMLLFYKNLKKGKAKSEALQAAKLLFIAQHEHPNAHPFFWAGFIGIGDMSAVR